MNWKDKLSLNVGEQVKFINKFEAGHLGQKERYSYDVVDINDRKVGSVKYIVETSIKAPFNETYSVAQYDDSGKQIIFECW